MPQELGNSAASVEGVVIRLEPFDSAQGTWPLGRYMGRPKGLTCRYGIVSWRSVPNWFDPYTCRGVVCVIKHKEWGWTNSSSPSHSMQMMLEVIHLLRSYYITSCIVW